MFSTRNNILAQVWETWSPYETAISKDINANILAHDYNTVDTMSKSPLFPPSRLVFTCLRNATATQDN